MAGNILAGAATLADTIGRRLRADTIRRRLRAGAEEAQSILRRLSEPSEATEAPIQQARAAAEQRLRNIEERQRAARARRGVGEDTPMARAERQAAEETRAQTLDRILGGLFGRRQLIAQEALGQQAALRGQQAGLEAQLDLSGAQDIGDIIRGVSGLGLFNRKTEEVNQPSHVSTTRFSVGIPRFLTPPPASTSAVAPFGAFGQGFQVRRNRRF